MDVFGRMIAIYVATISSFISIASAVGCHACFYGVCYSKISVLDGYHVSGQLAVDRTDNIIYFHYEDSKSIDHTAAYNLDDIRLNMIPDIDFSFARTVDQNNRDVYIGGANGIYKYSPISNKTTQYGLFDKTILHMQFKNKIYYTVLQTKGLFTFESKQSKNVSPLMNLTIDDFIIDSREDIYFLSESKVYRLKKGANQTTLFANAVYSLSVDSDEVPHFAHSGKRGLYKLDQKDDNLIEVGAFGTGVPFKSVFDNHNNVVYRENNSKKLYYLMPNYGKCKVLKRSQIKYKNFRKNMEVQAKDSRLVIRRLNDVNK